MAAHGKKYNSAREKINKDQLSPLNDALAKVKQLSYVKFDESVDINVNLGIDSAKSDQAVKGSVLLPHGSGKKARVLVFAKGDYAEEALKAGADYVGVDDLVAKIQSGWLEFEYAVATPDMMGVVGALAKILGPRGLLPNKKLGTVTQDVAAVVKDLKLGRQFFKNDKGGSVHFSVGRVSFEGDKLRDNFMAFMRALIASRPSSAKGRFLKKVVVSSTMGVGIPVALEDELKV
jgi:large subunit ribosomal protein L1